jgi:hypothetical protein
MSEDLRTQIEDSLAAFLDADLASAAVGLLNALGYQSEKTLDLDNTPDAFLSEFDNRDRKLRRDKALFARWKSVELLFQLTDDEIRNAGAQGTLDFGAGYTPGNYQSYLFFALDLEKDHYTRTQLADITREINLLFDMPAMLLMRHDGALTFAIIDRRLSKKDQGRDVLEKVKLIKDIRCHKPHRAHIEILHDLALPSLMAKHECGDFKQLHEAWRKTLDTNELNKRFYRELTDWYFWALDHVEFPADVEKDASTRNATNVIRLLTRLIFCWFLKEKGLIPASLFSARHLDGVLKSMKDDDSTFYRAILQNLFFGTLNQRMNTGGQVNRKFANDGSFHERKDEYGVKNLYRYQKLFAIDEDEALKLFADVPFLNGGLFDCLDKEDDSGKVIYVDGFTRNARKQPKVPNFLFFSDYRTLDLSDAFGDKKHKKEKVRGLINLLDSYKFTITENTPIEEEIALDPELLGKVFENLLASYNPETGTTARKQTGSFYTPREIVNYMVDESLIAYFKGKLEPRMDANERQLEDGKPDSRELASISGSNLDDRLRTLFAYTEEPHAFSDGEVDALIEAIDTCKILDPACGSGAFPMGILHKLVFILGKLDPHNERWKHKQVQKAEQIPDVSARETAVAAIEKDFETNDLDYGRKLYLIENCIYGVDIQPIAIQISKLRFFISLICDQRTNKNKAQNCGVRPLPNLETKFVAANTLISLDRGRGQELLMDQRLPTLEKQLAEIRHKHFAAQRRRDKLALQKQDAKLREEIAAVLADGGMSGDASHQLAAWDPYDQNNSAPFFDPEWMYGITDGFHVVIGNPPYVRHEDIKEYKPAFAEAYTCYKGTADLLVYFYERGCRMLSDGGTLSFITSNKYFRAGYGDKLRGYLAKEMHIRQLIDFGDAPVFEATAYPSIIVMSKTRTASSKRKLRALNWTRGDPISGFAQIFSMRAFGMKQSYLSANGWNLESPLVFDLINKLRNSGTPLGDYVGGRFYRGVLTGFNEAFVVDRETRDRLIAEDPKSEELLKPFLRGRDVKRWRVESKDLWLINTHNGYGETPRIDVEDYFAIKAHLDDVERRRVAGEFGEKARKAKGLFRRDDQGKTPYNLRNCVYIPEFSKPKIIYPDIYEHQSFALDSEGYFSANTTYFIPEGSPWLLAILNAKLTEWFYGSISNRVRGGYLRAFSDYIKQIPIMEAKAAERQILESMVQKITAAKKADPDANTDAWEREIDERVYRLYGLTKAEIAIVEGESSQ